MAVQSHRFFRLCFALIVLSFSTLVVSPVILHAADKQSDQSIKPTAAKFRLTYESVTLPANEKMGFMGGGFLYDISDWFSIGPFAYGALTGQRGGFITLGGAAELKRELTDALELNSGLFVGAGGGRGGFQLSGGGLMLRYHAGVTLKTDHFGHFGVGVSYLDFPDGTIHSTQPYFAYEYPFNTLVGSGWDYSNEAESAPVGRAFQAEQELAPVFRTYRIPSGVLADNGAAQHRTIHLMGAEWNRYLDDNWFLRIESEGAMGGKSNGYMQILLGAGYRMEVLDGTWLKLSASAGVAGGGNVATGGGFIVDGVVSLQQRLSEHLYAEVSGGYVKVPETNFRAISLAGKIGYHFFTPDLGEETIPMSDLASFNGSRFRIRAAHQSYLKDAPNWRTHHANLNVNNLGIQLDAFLHENFFLTGQGLAAYSGKAGAYMTGLVGAGVHLPLFGSPLFIEAEGLIGAAGGGGMAVGGGLVWQGNAGLGYQLTDAHSMIAQYGYMAAPKGNFRARVLTLAFAYNFSLFTR
ncbi:hypothetical protein [Mariprofundus ferrinatatus]|nr:hypothetical protein [Mariprofundus ferrinatatus]